MDGPLSVALSDIEMIRMETDAVVPIRPIFYKRSVNNIVVVRKIPVMCYMMF